MIQSNGVRGAVCLPPSVHYTSVINMHLLVHIYTYIHTYWRTYINIHTYWRTYIHYILSVCTHRLSDNWGTSPHIAQVLRVVVNQTLLCGHLSNQGSNTHRPIPWVDGGCPSSYVDDPFHNWDAASWVAIRRQLDQAPWGDIHPSIRTSTHPYVHTYILLLLLSKTKNMKSRSCQRCGTYIHTYINTYIQTCIHTLFLFCLYP